MPVVELSLQRGQQVYAQTGAMRYMTAGIRMETNMRGGVFGALKRSLVGEGSFLNSFIAEHDDARVAFGHTYPGVIIPLDVREQPMLCQRRAFLCATENVDFDIAMQKRLGAGLFGGEGFVLQRFEGDGTAFIEVDGECIERELAPGETIKVETSTVGAFQESVDMNIERVRGFKNVFAGGEGLFLTTLTGPGKIWLQTMPVGSMAAELSKYLTSKKSK